MLLSILIATVPERQLQYDALTTSLLFQKGERKDIEILADGSARSECSIGVKRQRLLNRASGEYILFIDDDDTVLPNYLEEILKALESKPDSVGLNILYIHNGSYRGMCHHSRKHPKWHTIEQTFYRGVTQFNPVKRSLALAAGFKDLRYGEDIDYSERLTPLCFKEVEINPIIYIYNYSNKEPHEKKYGIK
jgi:glycosyltransferase involved in cell wall biosynthesis